MTILAFCISGILLILAAIHMLWGFGYWFPTGDEERLVAAAVGARDVDRMPGPIPCGIVSGLLLCLIVVLWGSPTTLRSFVIWCAVSVFVGRGLLSYTRIWRRMTPQQPFATYDRRYYGPLCLGLGAGLAVLQAGGFPGL